MKAAHHTLTISLENIIEKTFLSHQILTCSHEKSRLQIIKMKLTFYLVCKKSCFILITHIELLIHSCNFDLTPAIKIDLTTSMTCLM